MSGKSGKATTARRSGSNPGASHMKTARRKSRDVEKAYSNAQFAAKLRRLADAVEGGGRFAIQVAGERIRVPANAVFNIEHERSGDEEEVEFQIKWQTE
jgi:amphi-Trp domain-containing protein